VPYKKYAIKNLAEINNPWRTSHPQTLLNETKSWGIAVVRTELKEIDFATATETMADGQKRAEIKKAEGIRQAEILKAEGEAQAIQLVNEAADKYFVGNAQLLRRLQTVEESLKNNSKIVLPQNGQLVNVIGDLAGVTPKQTENA